MIFKDASYYEQFASPPSAEDIAYYNATRLERRRIKHGLEPRLVLPNRSFSTVEFRPGTSTIVVWTTKEPT